MTEDTLVLPSLSPIGDKPISALIDDRCTSADGGLLLFQDVERRLNLADRLAACLQDPRQPGKITHRLDEILRFRMLAIVAGYPDGNDCDVLRGDPVFKMALDRPPVSGPALCSQPTVSRIENMPRRPELYRMAQAMLDLYCDSFPIVPATSPWISTKASIGSTASRNCASSTPITMIGAFCCFGARMPRLPGRMMSDRRRAPS